MPITSSAKKALRAGGRKRVYNLASKKSVDTVVKNFKKFVIAKDKKEAAKLLSGAFQAIDKAAQKGVIKKNNAARKKSRLSKLVK